LNLPAEHQPALRQRPWREQGGSVESIMQPPDVHEFYQYLRFQDYQVCILSRNLVPSGKGGARCEMDSTRVFRSPPGMTASL
jgi:hypothetical protein